MYHVLTRHIHVHTCTVYMYSLHVYASPVCKEILQYKPLEITSLLNVHLSPLYIFTRTPHAIARAHSELQNVTLKSGH